MPDVILPQDGHVYFGCRAHEPALDPTAIRQAEDGTWTFGRPSRSRSCTCGSGKLGWVQPGTSRVCGNCLRFGQDDRLPRVAAPPPKKAPKTPEGGVTPPARMSRREKRRAKFRAS